MKTSVHRTANVVRNVTMMNMGRFVFGTAARSQRGGTYYYCLGIFRLLLSHCHIGLKDFQDNVHKVSVSNLAFESILWRISDASRTCLRRNLHTIWNEVLYAKNRWVENLSL